MNTQKLKIYPEDLISGDFTRQLMIKEDFKKLGEILRQGGLVAFPTETVYGLGANALDGEAVGKIFKAKGRPSDNPLIVHIANNSDIYNLIEDGFNLSPEAKKLIEAFWPGPLTLVFPCSSRVPKEVTAGLNTVALRMPSHPVALELIKQAGVPVAAPSANLSGKPSPTLADHVVADLDGRVEAIIDGGPVEVGVESTVLDLTTNPPTLLRPGGVTLEVLRDILGEVKVDPGITEKGFVEGLKPRSPGMKYTHYAPEAKVLLVEGAPEKIGPKVKELVIGYQKEKLRVGILGSEENKHIYVDLANVEVVIAGSRKNLSSVAAGLFGCLRLFDSLGVDIIVAEGYDLEREGLAIMNRLRKAAGYNITKV